MNIALRFLPRSIIHIIFHVTGPIPNDPERDKINVESLKRIGETSVQEISKVMLEIIDENHKAGRLNNAEYQEAHEFFTKVDPITYEYDPVAERPIEELVPHIKDMCKTHPKANPGSNPEREFLKMETQKMVTMIFDPTTKHERRKTLVETINKNCQKTLLPEGITLQSLA